MRLLKDNDLTAALMLLIGIGYWLTGWRVRHWTSQIQSSGSATCDDHPIVGGMRRRGLPARTEDSDYA